jgi:methyl-accepting chemotaxis protein WspA
MDFNSILEKVVDETQNHIEKRSLFLFMNADQLAITTRLQDSQKYPLVEDKYVYVYATSGQYGESLIDVTLLDHGRGQLAVREKEQLVLGAFPVTDYQEHQIGVMVYAFEVGHEVNLIRNVTLTLINILLAILFLQGVIILVLYNRYIIKPIKKIVDFSDKVKSGDSQIVLAMKSQDEVGKMGVALNQMVLAQREIVAQIQHTGIQVTSSAAELVTTAKQQKATLSNQVELTDQVKKSVENISQVTAELVETMHHLALRSAETAEVANISQNNLLRMQNAMQSMEEASKFVFSRLEVINDKTKNINSIAIMITKVADQTNLLSLNAAIEAEKAGEYGRGFNVVAREIRRLADQTAVATLDIEKMIKEMQSVVSAGVMEINSFIAQIQHSVENVSQTSIQLSQIIEQVQALSPRFEKVNLAMGHQLEHARQINLAMGEVSEGMRQTADSLEESFLAIERLNEVAKQLTGSAFSV